MRGEGFSHKLIGSVLERTILVTDNALTSLSVCILVTDTYAQAVWPALRYRSLLFIFFSWPVLVTFYFIYCYLHCDSFKISVSQDKSKFDYVSVMTLHIFQKTIYVTVMKWNLLIALAADPFISCPKVYSI